MLILKHKIYFDSVINFEYLNKLFYSILIRQKESYGVVFRYRDRHNYAALVISEEIFEFRVYYNGVPRVISNFTNKGTII
jgi:hypothetical protein